MKAIISIATVLLLSAFSLTPNQNRLISGIVSDETGQPLIGVAIVEKGTNNGTATDIYGAYQISVSQQAKHLVFSYIGKETKTVKLGNALQINVTMKSAVIALEEVVAVEYEAIDTRDYEMVSPHVSNSMQGRVAGVQVRGLSGRHAKKSHYTSYAPEAGYVQHNTEGYSTIHENGFKWRYPWVWN